MKLPTITGLYPSSPYTADVKNRTEYYPYGWEIKLVGGAANTNRYGFNGQMRSDDIAGEGNHTTAEFWEYDTRLGRRWNLDPIDQISISNYATFANNPIVVSDLDGDEGYGDWLKPSEILKTKTIGPQFLNECKTLNTSHYKSVYDRFLWYKDAATFARTKIKTKWFDVSAEVVAPFSVGLIDAVPGFLTKHVDFSWTITDKTKGVLYKIADNIQKFNMNLVNEIQNNGSINGAKKGSFDNDLNILGKEQKVLQTVIDNLGTSDKNDFVKDYNDAFKFVMKLKVAPKYLDLAKEALGVEQLDFSNYNHRLAMGSAGLRLAYGMSTKPEDIQGDIKKITGEE